MADINGIPYVESSDLVSAYPAASQALAQEVSDQLASKGDVAGETWTGTHDFTGATVTGTIPNNSGAGVATEETTTSTSFTDLSTVGPSVTVTTGTKALVIITSYIRNLTSSQNAQVGFAISGSTTVAASATDALTLYATGAGVPYMRISWSKMVTGLTAGSNTFTAKYKVSGGTGQFSGRYISVIDMGS